MATRAPAGLIDFNAFLNGVEGAQRVNLNNQRMARQDVSDDIAIRNMLQTDADSRIKRDATTYLSSIPLNRIGAIRNGANMSTADHLIAQRDAILNDPYFQNNSPEFQNQVLDSLTNSAAVQMQNLNRAGNVNDVAKLADAFGQANQYTTDATRTALGGDYTQMADAVNRQYGTQFQVDGDGNVQVGDFKVPAYIALPAATSGGFPAAIKAAQEFQNAEQTRQRQSRSDSIDEAVTAEYLRKRGIDPAIFGINAPALSTQSTPAVTPTVDPTSPLIRSGTALDGWVDRQLANPGVATQDVSRNPGVSANSVVTPETPASAAQPVVPAVPSQAAAANDWRSLLTVEPQVPQTAQGLQQLQTQAQTIQRGRDQAAQSMALYNLNRSNLDQLIRETRGRNDISRKVKNALINGYRQQLEGANRQLMDVGNTVAQADQRLRDYADFIRAGQQLINAAPRR